MKNHRTIVAERGLHQALHVVRRRGNDHLQARNVRNAGVQALAYFLRHVRAHSGLKVVVPATPYDVKGLMKTALRDDCPVIFIEHKALYNIRETYPRGVSDSLRQGKYMPAWNDGNASGGGPHGACGAGCGADSRPGGISLRFWTPGRSPLSIGRASPPPSGKLPAVAVVEGGACVVRLFGRGLFRGLRGLLRQPRRASQADLRAVPRPMPSAPSWKIGFFPT